MLRRSRFKPSDNRKAMLGKLSSRVWSLGSLGEIGNLEKIENIGSLENLGAIGVILVIDSTLTIGAKK